MEIDYRRLPLSQDSPLASLSINLGLTSLRDEAFAAITDACKDKLRIEEEIAKYVDQVKYI